jgi:hypothetical protein
MAQLEVPQQEVQFIPEARAHLFEDQRVRTTLRDSYLQAPFLCPQDGIPQQIYFIWILVDHILLWARGYAVFGAITLMAWIHVSAMPNGDVQINHKLGDSLN